MRKEGIDSDRTRQPITINEEIFILIAHLIRAPKIIQKQFSPYLLELRKDIPNNQKLTLFSDYLLNQRHQNIDNSGPLVHNFVSLLPLKQLPKQLEIIHERIEKEISKGNIKKQEPFSYTDSFDKIDMIYPDYDSYYKMSKQQKSHLAQHHPKTKNRDFFLQPRFLVRIQQFSHFRNNDAHKGDVVYIQYQGNTIASGKVHLVANQKALQLWAQETNNYPIPTLTLPSEEETEKKKEEEKKDKEKPEEPTPTPMKFQFHHKFLGHSQKITSVSLSQDEYYAITGSADRTVRLWCLRLKVCLAIYRGHTKTIWDVNFSPSGYYFLSGSSDGLMLLWKTDQPQAQRAYHHDADIYHVSFAKDPSFVISAGEDATVNIWATLDASLLRKIKLSQPIINFHLGFSGAYIVTVQSDGRVTVFDLLRGALVNSFYIYQPLRRRKTQQKESKGSVLKIHDVCLSEDQRQLTCVCGHYVLIYSMDKLQKKITNNIFTFYKTNLESDVVVLEPKQALYLGGEANLTHCSYQSRNLLLVLGTFKQ